MTDGERFSLLVSVMGENPASRWRGTGASRGNSDERRLYAGRSAPWRPGAYDERRKHGVTPGYANREGDAATALPASIVLAASFNPDQLAVNCLAAV